MFKLRPFRFQFKYWQKIAAVIFLFTIIPIGLLGAAVIHNEWNVRINQILKESDIQLKNGVETINTLYSNDMNNCINISSSNQLQLFLSADPNSDLSFLYESFTDVTNAFDFFSRDLQDNIITIYAQTIPIKGEISFLKTYDAINSQWRNDILSSDNDYIWKYVVSTESPSSSRIHLYHKFDYKAGVSAITEFIIPITSVYSSLNFMMPEDSFLVYLPLNGEFIRMDTGGYPLGKISAEVDEYISKASSDEFFVTDKAIQVNGDRLLLFMSRNYVYGQMYGFYIEILLMALLITGLIIFTVIMTSKLLTNRLRNLVTEISSDIESGNFQPPALHKQSDELEKIRNRFYELGNIIKQYYKTLSQFELSKKSFELRLLQERINPHFLYNSLSSIKWSYPDNNLESIIDALVRYYRIALNKGNEILTVSEELDMISQYLLIQRFSYETEFLFEMDIDQQVMGYKILKHLLQPIVENAFLHGIMSLDEGGLLRISAHEKNGRIIFRVIDNGIGMDPEKLVGIFSADERNSSGYGLKNVNSRIKLYFGEEYGIEVQSVKNSGTTVTVTVPVMDSCESQ